MAEAGHNSGIKADDLKAFVERIENLMDDKKDLQEDIKTVFTQAKGAGFDVATIRRVIKLRAMDKRKRSEQADLLSTYCAAVGVEDLFL